MNSPEESGGKQFTETWLVLEYCDRGNLQDAVDRGVFVMHRGAQAVANGAATGENMCNVRSVRWVDLPLVPVGIQRKTCMHHAGMTLTSSS